MTPQLKKIAVTIVVTLIISIIVAYLMDKLKSIGKLKPVKPFQTFRQCDSHGCGYFGASRGSRTHKGVDIVVQEGEMIKSPIAGKITRHPKPYASDPNYQGIEIVNAQYKVKIFYCVPTVAIGTTVRAGEPIATAQNISEKYSAGMTNHVHLEVYNISGGVIDPAPLFG